MRTSGSMRLRLALLFFGEFAIWGLWFVSLGSWLGATLHFSGPQIGMVYATLAIAGLVTPMLGGAIADRLARTERMLGALHGAGGLLLIAASRQTSFASLYGAILLYALCFMPTLSLAPTLVLRHLVAADAEFPAVRTLGTVGWIAAGLLVGALGLELTPTPLFIAGCASLVFAAYCLTLPATPPLAADAPRRVTTLLGLDAFVMLRDPLFLLFVIATVVLSVPNQFYNAFAALYLTDVGMPHPAMLLTLGQMSEVVVLLLLPRLHRRLGLRRMLVLGAAAWSVRSLLFSAGAAGSVPAVYAGILMHGIMYGFIYVAGQLMVHERTPVSMRASAQGLMSVATMGVGNLGGAWIAGAVVAVQTSASGVRAWSSIWLVAAGVAAAATLGVMLSVRVSDAPVLPRER